MNEGQVASATEFWFELQSSKWTLGFFLVQMACSSSNSRVFMSTEVGTGSDGEERVIVQYLEYGANIGPSAPRTEEETVIDIDPPHFKNAQSSPYVGEARNNSSPKVDGEDPSLGGHPRGGPGEGGGGPGGGGSGGGGGGPGGGGPGGGEGGPGGGGPGGGGGGPGGGGPGGGGGGPGGGGPDGGELDLKELHKALKKLAKTSIFISAQTGTALLSVAGSTPKSILYSIVAINVCSYVFCMFSFLVSESKPLVGVIMSAAGSLLAALGLLLTMSIIIPTEFIQVLAISTIFLLLSLSALAF